MYIAVCDDQTEELDMLKELLDRWQRERQTSLQFKAFRSAAHLLDAAAQEKYTLYPGALLPAQSHPRGIAFSHSQPSLPATSGTPGRTDPEMRLHADPDTVLTVSLCGS